jgi:hypothetical protein
MASILPPSPQGVPPGHAFWNVWYEKLRTIINDLATSISWLNINFTGSKIEDIVSRDHNKLTTIQGGTTAEYYHLTSAEHTSISSIGSLILNSKAGDPTTSDIASGYSKLYKNTSTSAIKLWVNDSGTLKSVTLT